ncbi:MAG: TRM11 family SAM-dependent methyltransferase [Candidatus Nealsonbacteria bacterium]
MAKINDLNLNNWKEYKDILTDSLWIIGARDKSGAHTGEYHGNFIPQIPTQLMRRFTKKGDVVLDTFLGGGTTLIECRRLGRHGIGIELISKIARMAKNNIAKQKFLNGGIKTSIIVGDSTQKKTRDLTTQMLKNYRKKNVQLIIMHPPYHDIIKFSNNPDDLCNTGSVEEFTKKLGAVVNNFIDLLEKKHYLAIVIGDKYTNSEWVPLGFYTMQETMKNPSLKLKSILVKNMVGNRAKRNQENLWRYRALVGGFYIFRHEYILLFQRT